MPMVVRIIRHVFSASYMLVIKIVPLISSGMKVLKRPGIDRIIVGHRNRCIVILMLNTFEQYIFLCVSIFEYVLGPMQHFLRLWGSPPMCVAMHSQG